MIDKQWEKEQASRCCIADAYLCQSENQLYNNPKMAKLVFSHFLVIDQKGPLSVFGVLDKGDYFRNYQNISAFGIILAKNVQFCAKNMSFCQNYPIQN